MLLLFLPILYIPFTVIIISRIVSKTKIAIKEKDVNVELFKSMSITHFLSLLFFLADLFYIRIPITGLLTNWCANIQPNGYLVIPIIITYHLNYSVMLMPFLVSFIRINCILLPRSHRKINSKILKFSIPIILFYPVLFTFFMYPAVGYCHPAVYPLHFGAIVFRVDQTLFGLKNNIGLIFNSLFWLSACLIIDSVFIFKLIKLKFTLTSHSKSQKTHKAEISLTLTSISMIISYLTNGMIALGGLFLPAYNTYFIILRPFMNDIYTCIVPWILYLTHPVFRKKSNQVLAFR